MNDPELRPSVSEPFVQVVMPGDAKRTSWLIVRHSVAGPRAVGSAVAIILIFAILGQFGPLKELGWALAIVILVFYPIAVWSTARSIRMNLTRTQPERTQISVQYGRESFRIITWYSDATIKYDLFGGIRRYKDSILFMSSTGTIAAVISSELLPEEWFEHIRIRIGQN